MTATLDRRHFAGLLLGAAAFVPTAWAAANAPAGDALATVANPSQRSAGNAARDIYRHPVESLTFWGLKPGDTIVEIDPGPKGYWLEMLAPFANLSGGSYHASLAVLDAPGMTDDAKARAAAAHQAFQDEITAMPTTQNAKGFEFGPAKLDAFPVGTADFVLVARAFHNWARQGDTTDQYLKAFHTMLKPGGILAVEQHRAPEGSDPTAGTGYVPESYVIGAAEKAGFLLDGRSEINANPKDSKNYPFGVWTLPPVRKSSDGNLTLTADQRASYDAIGESDRMTLRFKKV